MAILMFLYGNQNLTYEKNTEVRRDTSFFKVCLLFPKVIVTWVKVFPACVFHYFYLHYLDETCHNVLCCTPCYMHVMSTLKSFKGQM